MKKFRVPALLLVAAVLIAVFAGCVPEAEEENVLRLITPTAESNLTVLLPKFEEATGIKVEYVVKPTAETVTNLKETKDSPIYDITWLPEVNILENKTLFANYVSSHDSEYDAKFRNTTGVATNINYAIPCILYNKTLCSGAGVTITGYQSLLDTKLKGHIDYGAISSSSTYNHIENMLLAMGTGATDSDKAGSTAAWNYVSSFLTNLNGKDNIGSSAMLNRVASGECWAAMSYDTQGQTALQNSGNAYSNVGVVFMTEGVVPKNSSVAIVKGGREELAKEFIEWMSGSEAQDLIGLDCPGANPLLSTAQTATYKAKLSQLNVISIDAVWSASVKPLVVSNYNSIYRSIFA